MVRDCGIVPLSMCSKTSPRTSTHSKLVIEVAFVNALPLVDPLTISPPFCSAICSIASVCHVCKFAKLPAEAFPYRINAFKKELEVRAILKAIVSIIN